MAQLHPPYDGAAALHSSSSQTCAQVYCTRLLCDTAETNNCHLRSIPDRYVALSIAPSDCPKHLHCLRARHYDRTRFNSHAWPTGELRCRAPSSALQARASSLSLARAPDLRAL